MDQQGYEYINSGGINEKALVHSLSVEENALGHPGSSDSAEHLSSADHQQEWQQAMEHGFNLDIVLLRHFGTAQGLVRQGPIIHNLAPNSTGTRLRRAHPCVQGISIWRPIRGGLGAENGLFKVYPGSQGIRTENELRDSQISTLEIRIRADQVFIAHGGLWIEEGNGNGILMWMGVSADIIGLYIDKYCLPFVAGAYNASRFLSRTVPPGLVKAETQATLADSFFPQERLVRAGNHRSNTADAFLRSAIPYTSRILEYFTNLDPTGIILAACPAGEDPRMAFLTVDRGTDIRKWFLRALAVRCLIRRYHSRGGTLEDFIRADGLPKTSRLINTIRHGKKLYWIELSLRKPGIWITLLNVMSRLDHITWEEVFSIPDSIHRYPTLLEIPEEWSPLMEGCTQLLGSLAPPGASDGCVTPGQSFD
ncbi:hypothetical protein AlacWU_02693 [Aspergillus niger]|nr:hypothetical protein AlacWU_02693 [Aspergillus niger]